MRREQDERPHLHGPVRRYEYRRELLSLEADRPTRGAGQKPGGPAPFNFSSRRDAP